MAYLSHAVGLEILHGLPSLRDCRKSGLRWLGTVDTTGGNMAAGQGYGGIMAAKSMNETISAEYGSAVEKWTQGRKHGGTRYIDCDRVDREITVGGVESKMG